MNAPVSMQDLQKSQAKTGNASGALSTFPVMLKKMTGEIGNALPKHITADRMTRIALTEFRKNKQLSDCDPRTICASIVIASQLGLEPGVMGQGYLVPYKGTCQFIPGWQGLVDLVSRTGRGTVWTGAVFNGDEFDYSFGDRPFITHKPGDEAGNPKALMYVYAVGRVKNAEWPIIDVWSVKKVTKHRDYYNKVGDRHYSFDNFEMYARKVVLLQILKYMPKSVELATAVDLEHSANRDKGQNISLDDALNGEYVDMTTNAEEETEKTPAKTKEEAPKPEKHADKPEPAKPRDDAPPPSDLFTSFRDQMKDCASTSDLVLIKKEIELKLRNNADERELLLDHLARRMADLSKKEPTQRPTRTIE